MTQTASKSDRAILSLLMAAKKGPPAEVEPNEATDYDWNVPCSFTPAQLEKLQRFAERAGAEIAKMLGAQLHEEVELLPEKLSEHYAARLGLLEDHADSYHVPIAGEGGEQCGLVVIPGELARGWVAKALGSTESTAGQERELSSLESALMQDTVAMVVEAFSAELQAIGGRVLQCGRQGPDKAALPDAKDEREYCVLAFRAGQGSDQPAISFVLASDVLAEAIDAAATRQSADRPSEDSRKDMLASIKAASVTATVGLSMIGLTLREFMSLEEGDLLITDSRIDRPLELLVDGEAVLSGHPVSCDGQYALRIAARDGTTGRDRAPT